MKNAARASRQGIGNARCRTVVPTVIYLREDRSESYSKRIPGVDPRLTTSTTTLRRRPPSTERVATAYSRDWQRGVCSSAGNPDARRHSGQR